MNVSKQQLQGCVVAGLGVTLIACEAAQALAWLDDAHRQCMAA